MTTGEGSGVPAMCLIAIAWWLIGGSMALGYFLLGWGIFLLIDAVHEYYKKWKEWENR